MTFAPAVREATPVVISLAGRSGSGKTYSALLMARGLAGPDGKVCVIDSENKRAGMYADDPVAGGFFKSDLYPPFTAEAYIQKIKDAEAFGADVLVIDSMSHEWSGIGGCREQAEKIEAAMRNPNSIAAWNKPKAAHRRLVNTLLAAQCHVICCLRAEHKMVQAVDDKGKKEWVESDRLIPEQEKKFIYEMTLSATLDEATHLPEFTKIPKPLLGAFPANELIGIQTGEIVREWVNGGAAVDKEAEAAMAALRDVASQWGAEAMRQHWKQHIPKEIKQRLSARMGELEKIAAEADRINSQAEDEPQDSAPIAEGAGL